MVSFLYYFFEVNVMQNNFSQKWRIFLNWISILVPFISFVIAGMLFLNNTNRKEISNGDRIAILLSLISFGFSLTNVLLQLKSTDNRWLINKEVECFENIIDSCQYYKIIIDEYENNRINVKYLVGIHRIELLKTLISNQRSIENYKNYLTGKDKSEKIFEKLSDLIDKVIDCTDNYEKLKKYLKDIIQLSYQLINLSPYIYSDVNKKEIDRKTQEVLKGCD